MKPDARTRRGIALVPAILVVSGLAIFSVALLTAVLSGSRTVVRQDEAYQVSSAVESVATLAAENLWSSYVAAQGGAAGDIETFRDYLTAQGIDDAGPGGLPAAGDGRDLAGALALPTEGGRARLNAVNIDAVRLVRRDVNEATQLFLTVSASTSRGEGMVNPVLNRAVQQVYTVEPADFPGFEYALLANNVNCIFCHTRVDNAERWWNRDGAAAGTFPRVKVGTLESLIVRKDGDGLAAYNDYDADSFIAGTLYMRGLPAESDGDPLLDWNSQSLRNHPFDADGSIQEDAFGLGLAAFSPAGVPPDPLENLYRDYPLAYAEQVDGYLPDHFPAPFADDGGVDPLSGLFDAAAVNNRRVDDCEFLEVASSANGAITAGIVNLTPPGDVISSLIEYQDAATSGNQSGLIGNADGTGRGVQGNVILTGRPDNPIWIDGTLAIDGDLMIQGHIKGSGSIYVRGNVYVPSDLIYADGQAYLPGDMPGSPTGPRTFGIAQDGTKNALALTAGGNILVGDFQRPATLQPDGTYVTPGALQMVTGTTAGKWNFTLAEIAIFNRAEWAKTQPTLPGPGGSVVANPGYVVDYVPRYYGYAEGTTIPIFNLGSYFRDDTGTWIGLETPISWDPTYLTWADPANLADSILYDPDGTPRAVTSTVLHEDGWMTPIVYKRSVNLFANAHTAGTPMLIDGLLYTNNAIFSIVYRNSNYDGRMLVNGMLVAADLGMLVPGKPDAANLLSNHGPLSDYAIGLQLNYDQRLRKTLSVKNPFQVTLKRTYWNPTANLL